MLFDPRRTGSHERANVMRKHLERLSASLTESARRRTSELRHLDFLGGRQCAKLARRAAALVEQMTGWTDETSVEDRMRDLLAYQDLVGAARLLGVEADAA